MDSTICHTLAEKISQIARSTPPELVSSVLPRLIAWDSANPTLSRAKALANIHNPQVRADFGAFLDLWLRECPEIPGSALALALQSSLALEEYHHQVQVDLTWTGPETKIIPLRRTDQALLQLIDTARQELFIVSFAVYKIRSISEALERAVRRGVELCILLEHPDESGGKISFAGEHQFSKEVLSTARLYVWPFDQRPRSEDGKHGSLHAKLALADEDLLFISSANLTDYAMNLNMEMGVLIQGGELPVQVSKHFAELLAAGFLIRV